MTKLSTAVLSMLTLVVATGCSDRASVRDTYTLYRSSLVEGVSRIHVATFDAKGGDGYNLGNCDLAADLFQHQDDVKVRFWCEKGGYKK